jgi:UDP-glucose:(heptosyl)LPS alpha-1,3-glucosyltransferase
MRAAATPASEEVVVVAHDIGPIGGMEKQLSVLISGLIEAGWRVTVLSRSCGIPPHEGLQWVRVPGPTKPFSIAYPWFAVVATAMLLKYGRRRVVHTTGAIVLNRADVITVHLCHKALFGKGVKRVSRMNPLYRLNAKFASLLSRVGESWCYSPRRTSCLVAVSEGLRSELCRQTCVEASRIKVIPNGVDTAVFRPDPARRSTTRGKLALSADDLVALFVGSEWERKGLRHALEAVASARRWHLLVVGRGDESRYRLLSRQLGVGQRTHFVEPTTDTASYYAAADAFVLPSAYETFSMVTYEAAASGLPIIATQVSGIEDVVVDGVNGWFVEPRALDIARRLGELELAPDVRRSMGHRSREAVARFGWDRAVVSYLSLYRELGRRDESIDFEAVQC